jgi:hypothetical protein
MLINNATVPALTVALEDGDERFRIETRANALVEVHALVIRGARGASIEGLGYKVRKDGTVGLNRAQVRLGKADLPESLRTIVGEALGHLRAGTTVADDGLDAMVIPGNPPAPSRV